MSGPAAHITSRHRPTPSKLFPLIDAFGQYVHRDWPGKIHTAADFAERKKAEVEDLASHPGPGDWNQYGGWKAGPRLAASGRFRVENREGKWWFVDPEGRLFWSHGIDCVRMENSTPTTDREHWFAALPAKSDLLGRFYGHGNWAPHGYYKDKSYETFNFTGANLWHKFGDDWNRASAVNVHVRLRSWGMNTIGNWSDASVLAIRRTPYVATIHVDGRLIEGSEGYWGKFSDPFDASFAESARKGMAAERKRVVGDPWCLGYFLGNELSWGTETSLASAALTSPADQPAKKAFLADLKAKYGEIERLNATWGTHHASWASLADDRTAPEHQEGSQRLDRLLHPDRRAVLPHLPRGCQGSRPARALPGLPLRLGQRSGRARVGQILRRGQLQPLPAERSRSASAQWHRPAADYRRVPFRCP